MRMDGQRIFLIPVSISLVSLLCGCNLLNGFSMNASGIRHFKSGNYAMAQQAFRRAMTDVPHSADYIHNFATAKKKQGDLKGAEKTYQYALNVNPAHQPSYHSLAVLFMEQDRNFEGQKLLQEWVDTQPYVAEPHIEMAWFKREIGDTVGSEQALQQALRIHPNHYVATSHLGQLYQDTGQRDRALAMYQRSLHSNWFQPQVQSRVFSLGHSPTTMISRAPQVAPGLPSARPLRSPVASYGTPQRVTLLHPLPTYDHVANQSMVSHPGATPSQPVRLGLSRIDADPQHAPQISSELPEVRAY